MTTRRNSFRDWNPATTRLRPMLVRRGYTPGAARLRLGTLVYVIALALACGGVTFGTIAIAGVVRTIVGAP